jgi:hypothetical protein
MALTTLLNTIRDNASADYVARVPVATDANITAVGNPITSYTPTMNEFLTLLVNKIAMTLVHDRTLQNPLAILKKGGMPLGKDMEELWVNPATADTFDGSDSANPWTQKKPDVKVIYHRMNRQDVYEVTITRQQLKAAFVSYEALGQLIEAITNSLYSGDNYDEFMLFKNLMRDAIDAAEVVKINLDANVTDEATAKDLIRHIKTVSKAMQFPGSTFNSYTPGVGENKVITWTPANRQILILRSDVSALIDVDVLATAFNMNKAEIGTRTFEVDTFMEAEGDRPVYALLVDESWFQIWENLEELHDIFNPKGLYYNLFYHRWQTISYSLLCNAVAFLGVDPTP